MTLAVAEVMPSRADGSGFDLEFIGDDGKPVSGRLEDCWHHKFEEAPPFRDFPSFKGQKNFSGLWWSPKSSGHVGYESWLERDHAMMLDFTASVTRFSSQPFQMLWREGGRLRRHVPDYFARFKDGTALVLDVRPDNLIEPADAEAFAATQRPCDSVGWRFRRVGTLDPMLRANVRWLAAYRHPRCLREDLAESVKEAFRTPRPLGEALQSAEPRLAMLPTAFHLMWTHVLTADLQTALLSLWSVISMSETSRR